MKTSLITTVYNEENSIEELLNSIKKQTTQPSEVVIHDAGSTDNTIKEILAYKNKIKNLRVIKTKLVARGKGRNKAIEAAKNDIIAATDAGCTLDKHWLEHLTAPFKDKKVMAVAGIYKPYGKNLFEKCQALVAYKDLSSVSEGFSPSHRNIAFRKKAWKAIGKYDNYLYSAEDTLFNLNMMKRYGPMFVANNAVVSWRVRPTLYKVASQFFVYGMVDGESEIIWRMPVNLAFSLGVLGLFGLSITYPLALLPVVGYGCIQGLRCVKKFKNISSFWHGFSVSLAKRLGYAFGVVTGLIKRVIPGRKKR